MLRSKISETRIWFVVLNLSWAYFAGEVAAQSSRALVVVTDASDEDSVRRIGDNLVEVKMLWPPKVDAKPSDYYACNYRAKDLVEFRLLFYREVSEGMVERFWRSRLTAANPDGVMQCLSPSRIGLEIDGKVERARIIREALSSAFPRAREQLDANLQLELHRLNSMKIASLQVAVHNGSKIPLDFASVWFCSRRLLTD